MPIKLEVRRTKDESIDKWVAHKGPFEHVGNGVMKCPRCGLEGRGSMVFQQVSCIPTWAEEEEEDL